MAREGQGDPCWRRDMMMMICISKSKKILLCISFSKTDPDLYIYHLVAWSNFNLLHNSQWIFFPTQTCLNFYFFCTSLLHLIYILLLLLFYSLRVFASTHFGVISQKYEWQQVCSSLQDSSQYSGWRQQCCSLNFFSLVLNCSNPLSNSLGTVPNTPTTIGISVTLMFNRFF